MKYSGATFSKALLDPRVYQGYFISHAIFIKTFGTKVKIVKYFLTEKKNVQVIEN